MTETQARAEEGTVQKRRAVAIVGRPNVGKSAIFNRLVGRRVAIVHAQSGVTRDRLMREATWGDQRFDLIDTGGLCNIDGESSQDIIERGIDAQVRAALDDAAVAMLVVDVQTGLHPLDTEVARLLHAAGQTTIVAANKADNAARELDAAEFEGLGFPVFPVAALHDRGFDPLMDAVTAALPETVNLTVAEPLKVAIVGRPNVGKSSYINRLLQSDRVIVSDIPGTTRDSIDIPFVVGEGEQARHYQLIDTAGMRRVGKIDSSVERFSRFRAEKSIRRADLCVLVLDATQGVTAQDKRIAAAVMDAARGCVLLVNKWDLEDRKKREYASELADRIPFLSFCPVIFASALTGHNIRRSVDAIDHVASQVRATLPTGVLNRTIEDAVERVHPPSVGGKRLKLFYATQVGQSPLRVRIFVNDPKRVKPAYEQFLIKTLRSRFGLEGAPIRLSFSPRR